MQVCSHATLFGLSIKIIYSPEFPLLAIVQPVGAVAVFLLEQVLSGFCENLSLVWLEISVLLSPEFWVMMSCPKVTRHLRVQWCN